MLKHKDIIDKLTKEQKIALLTDARDTLGGEVEAMGLPSVALSDIWESNSFDDTRELLFPTAKSLANSWDNKLFGDVAKCLATIGHENGNNLFLLPSTSAPSSIYGKEIAEEPYLSGALVSGMVDGLKEVNAPFCMTAPVCTRQDVRFLDKVADPAVLYDRIARPFTMAVNDGGCRAVLIPDNTVDGDYEKINQRILNDTLPKNCEQIYKVADADQTTTAIIQGKQVLGGSALVMSTALENYNRIYRSMEEGGATAQELNMTLLDGAAISEEIIDEALDKKLELAYDCSKRFSYVSNEDMKQQAYISSLESIVLLKNNARILPLRKSDSVCAIGGIIKDSEECLFKGFREKFADAVKDCGFTYVGYAGGYRVSENVNEELIPEACNLASKSSVACVFVGLGATREARLQKTCRLSLPANQIALLSALKRQGKKIVCVICGETLPDMSFDKLADAIIFMPPQGAYGARAICDVITGKYNPSGRLAYAGYYAPDREFRQIQKRKRNGEQLIGPFVGHRYGDANGELAKYPFGFGLSYTSFAYSRLSIGKNAEVQFTIRNTGHIAGVEVAQVYVSKRDSALLRPKKELKAVVRVYLKPGEKCNVKVSIQDLEIYDTASGGFVTEQGQYDIQICSSSAKTELIGRIRVFGSELTWDNKKLSDHLQNVTNIRSEGYTMEANCKKMKIKSKLKTFGGILLAATLLADIAYIISCMMLGFDIMENLVLVSILSSVGFVLSIICMVAGNSKVAKLRRAQERIELEATEEMFKTVKQVDAKSYDELFEDEFDVSLEAEEDEVVDYSDKDEATYTYMSVDTDIPTLCKDLEGHFAEYGLSISAKMARKLLSAVMTSRLLVVRNSLGIELEKIVEILSRFFGTEPHYEKVNGAKWERQSLLRFTSSVDNSTRQAPLMHAFNAAGAEGDKPCFYGISNACLEDAGKMLMPFVQYFGNPDIEHSVMDINGSIDIPSNLWFVLSPNKGESLDSLPAFVSNLATVVDFEAIKCSEASFKTVRKTITCHQLDALIFRAKKATEIGEDIWKHVDNLEAFVNDRTPYHIGNKLFLQLEKYMAIYTTTGGEMYEAIDNAVSGKLLPAILNMLKGNESMQDVDFAQVVESIFGEEYAINCRNTIKRLVIDRAEIPLSKQQTTVEATPVAEPEKVEPTPVEEPAAAEVSVEPTPVEEPATAEASVEEAVAEENKEVQGEGQDEA